jgi:hypothetical protein
MLVQGRIRKQRWSGNSHMIMSASHTPKMMITSNDGNRMCMIPILYEFLFPRSIDVSIRDEDVCGLC